MEVIADSHALFWLISGSKKLSKKAREILAEASRIIVPTIVLLELLYILQKYGQEDKFSTLLSELTRDRYLVYPIDLALVKECAKVEKNLEMHDRLIVACARVFGSPIVSKDKEIRKFYPRTI